MPLSIRPQNSEFRAPFFRLFSGEKVGEQNQSLRAGSTIVDQDRLLFEAFLLLAVSDQEKRIGLSRLALDDVGNHIATA